MPCQLSSQLAHKAFSQDMPLPLVLLESIRCSARGQSWYLCLAEEDLVADWAGCCGAPAQLHPHLLPVQGGVEQEHLERPLLLDLQTHAHSSICSSRQSTQRPGLSYWHCWTQLTLSAREHVVLILCIAALAE